MPTERVLLVREGHSRVAVSADLRGPVVEGGRFAHLRLPVASATASLAPRTATVEVSLARGGQQPRARLGGTWRPGDGPELTIGLHLVAETGEVARALDVPSLLGSGPGLVAGVPMELAAAVLSGLLVGPIRAGQVLVDRGGHDPVESSGLVFELAARILSTVLHSEPAEGPIRRLLQQV